jgi:RNA recognition motif. (a.k.a. RRM, RBD, or RNP domain)
MFDRPHFIYLSNEATSNSFQNLVVFHLILENMAPSRAKKSKEEADVPAEEEEESPFKPEATTKSSKKSKKKKKKKRKSKSPENADEKDDEPAGVPKKKEKKSKRRKLNEKEHVAENDEGKKDDAIKVSENSGDEDDDDDDEDLLAAAAMWAGDSKIENLKSKSGTDRNGKDEKTSRAKKDEKENSDDVESTPQFLSLHITQLPFDATEMDLRKFFAEQGCSVTSIRLVYDHDVRGQKTVFRGVAFVDMLDRSSYDHALQLNHKASIRGRKLNIRPTRSKEELASIVSRTKDLVQEKIRQQRSGEAKSESTPKLAASKEEKRNKEKNDKQKDKPHKKETKDPTGKSKGNAKRVDADGKPVKMTKKERNRRAAIIMGLKNKRVAK